MSTNDDAHSDTMISQRELLVGLACGASTIAFVTSPDSAHASAGSAMPIGASVELRPSEGVVTAALPLVWYGAGAFALLIAANSAVVVGFLKDKLSELGVQFDSVGNPGNSSSTPPNK